MAKPLQHRFIADVMVGRLARWLRILGFDVLYSNQYGDDEILRIAGEENRVILTRDVPLSARATLCKAVMIEADDYESQVAQVIKAMNLSEFHVFSRCPECNELLEEVDKENVFERIPPYIYLTHEEFAECPGCRRVYWRGTHADEITAKIRRWSET